jgi:hypothetical protein
VVVGAFGALTLFAFYLLWRGWRADRDRRRCEPGWECAYVGDVGFTPISRFAGFVIVAALDLGAPVWLVAGRFLIDPDEQRMSAETAIRGPSWTD